MNVRKINTISQKIFFSSFLLLLPLLVVAQSGDSFDTTITKFINYALSAINFLLVLATLVFLWGIIRYVSAGGDAAKVKEARSYILWGIIGLAIMGSVWALIHFLEDNLGIGTDEEQTIPKYGI
ncbi:MAG: hypothetical protein Q7R73_03170 [bacterium]|nr:hypothetical protein [bacterium]